MAGSKSKYSEETRAAAMAALLTGQSVSQVAREYKLPKGTVSDWKRKARARVKQSRQESGVGPDPTQKRSLDDMLLEYVEENLTTLKAQAKVFSDEEWLKRYPPSEAAVLHGVIADKTVRLLEAFGGAG